MSRAFLVCLGNKALATHGLLDVLVGQRFLGSFANFLFDHLLGFSFHTACQPHFRALKSVTGGFQGISCPFKPTETSANHVHHQPFSILIVFVGSKSRQTATDHVDFQPQSNEEEELSGTTMDEREFLALFILDSAHDFVLPCLCLFEMQRDDGIAWSKLGQISIGFGH